VFDQDTIDDLQNFVKSQAGSKYKADFQQKTGDLFDLCSRRDIPVYMMASEPLRWCLPIARYLDTRIPITKIICHDIANRVKPDLEMYHYAEWYVKMRENNDNVRIYYVDTRGINLLPAKKLSRWYPITLNTEDASGCSSYDELTTFLRNHTR